MVGRGGEREEGVGRWVGGWAGGRGGYCLLSHRCRFRRFRHYHFLLLLLLLLLLLRFLPRDGDNSLDRGRNIVCDRGSER